MFTSSQIEELLTSKQINTSQSQSTPNQKRFKEVSTENDILRRMKEIVPQKTKYQNSWGASAWRQWAEWRNTIEDNTLPNGFDKVPLFIQELSEEQLGFWLSRFVLEVKKKNGGEYPPNSLYQICCSIQRNFNDRSSGKFKLTNIFNKDDQKFFKFYEALDSKMRELTHEGLGIKVKHADFILPEEEEKLWESKVINLETAQGLLNGIYFYNTKCFSLRGGQIHRDLKKEQYEIDIDLESGIEVLKFYERLSKTSQCGLKGRKIKPRIGEIFAEPHNNHCVVRLFKTYLSKIPDGPLYLKPTTCKGTEMFTNKVIGKNTLAQMMPKMFKASNIDVGERRITGHSGRVTMCTTLFNNGFSENSVRKRSGHRSNALDLYMREKVDMRKRISSCLQAVDSKKVKFDKPPSPTVVSSTSKKNPNPSSLESALNFVKEHGKGEVKVNPDGSFSILFS